MNHFMSLLKNIIRNILYIRNEEKKVLEIIESLNLSKNQVILDVGTGRGRYIKLLGHASDANIIGIEINKELIEQSKEAGLNVISIEEFEMLDNQYDVILMSHIIEHFNPVDLLAFIDTYLDKLRKGGVLIIATPLHSSYFYDDFDHVRPYRPTGIQLVFGSHKKQVQYYSRNKLELIDIWFRKAPYRLVNYAGLYLHKYSRLPTLFNVILAILFRLTYGFIGQKNGWIGVYRKL